VPAAARVAPGKCPILKTKDSTALSPGGEDPARQLRKNTYIRFQAGHVTPLAELLLDVAPAMYEMYAAIMWISEDTVVTLVARRPDRIINPEVVYAFVGVENVKFVFLAKSDCCTGGGCPSLPPDPRRTWRTAGQDHDGVGHDAGVPGAGVPE
jgi:hypothetical protein